MKLFSKLMVSILLLSIQFVNAQTSCDTWITIFDNDTGAVLQEIKNGSVYSSKGCVPGPEASIRVKIQQDCSNSPEGAGCQSPPHFTTTNFHGNYDYPVAGSEVYTNGWLTEFVTNIIGGPITISGIQCNGLRVKAAIKMCGADPDPDPENPIDPCAFCPPGTENCLAYDIKKCCEMNCLILSLKDPRKCPGCYLVTVLFDDGTTAVLNVSFNGNDRLMYCYSKKISSVLSIAPYDCPNNCGDAPIREKVSVKESPKEIEKTPEAIKDRIILSPNPAKTVVTFEGTKLSDYSISLYDEAGKQVLHQNAINSNLSLERLSKGIYIYKITGKDGYQQSGKIIKE